MPCCGGGVPTDPEGLVAKVEEVKDQVMEMMDDVGDKLTKLSEEFTEGISMDPVTEAMDGMVGKFRELADDPSKILGAAAACACCLPLGQIKETIGELAETISSVGSGFGALGKLMEFVNQMIEGLSGIGEAISTTVSALGELPDLLGNVKDALTGGGDKAGAASSIDTFLESAGLKSTASAMDAVLKPIESISKSKELEAVIEMIGNLTKFIVEAPGRLKSMIPPIPCLPIPDGVKMLISTIEGFAGMFDANAIEKVLNMAAGQKGVSAGSITSPLTGLESSLKGAQMVLKMG